MGWMVFRTLLRKSLGCRLTDRHCSILIFIWDNYPNDVISLLSRLVHCDSQGDKPVDDRVNKACIMYFQIVSYHTFCIVLGEDLSSLPDEELNNIRRLSKDCSMLHENIRLEGSTTGQQVNSGVMPVQRRESMPAEKENVEVNVGGHQKTASEPVTTKDVCNNNKQMPGSENKNVSNKRLDEYHKWKVSGCKGDPPAKLKISQC
ncbi:hypothetical protein ACROYT_G031238 [Oculina patagonica]